MKSADACLTYSDSLIGNLKPVTLIPTVGIPDLPELTNSKTQDHGTPIDRSCHQVNLACLTDGVGVDRGGGGQGLWNSLSVTRQPWCYVMMPLSSAAIWGNLLH